MVLDLATAAQRYRAHPYAVNTDGVAEPSLGPGATLRDG